MLPVGRHWCCMHCPICLFSLSRSHYEGLPVFRCDLCNGYLVATRRVSGISRCREKAPDDLKREALAVAGMESGQNLQCPRCGRPMDKDHWPRVKTFQIDKCRECELVWFDTGELARLQLEYEATPIAQEAARFQDRHRRMTPEEQQQFEENLARLPEGDASLLSAFGEGLIDSLRNLHRTLSR